MAPFHLSWILQVKGAEDWGNMNLWLVLPLIIIIIINQHRFVVTLVVVGEGLAVIGQKSRGRSNGLAIANKYWPEVFFIGMVGTWRSSDQVQAWILIIHCNRRSKSCPLIAVVSP